MQEGARLIDQPSKLDTFLHEAGTIFEVDLDPTLDWTAYEPPLTMTPRILDWAIYKTGERVYLEGTKDAFDDGNFLPLRPSESHTLLARKRDRFIVYVLAPTLNDLTKARDTFAEYPWARPILIPTTFYLESVMYYHILPMRIEEWEHADYVGTISHTAVKKLNDFTKIGTVLREGKSIDAALVSFMYRGDCLIAAAERYHPGFLKLWAPTLHFLGFPLDLVLSEEIPSFYCNYWASTPMAMKKYIDFFKKFKHCLEELPHVSRDIWANSNYGGRSITPEKRLEIWGVPWYPFHPFICERLPCFYFWEVGTVMLTSSL